MPTNPRAGRFLEAALCLTIIAHGFAMLGMATLLLPGMPGGPHLDIAARAIYVADHPWLWRIGWLGWQLTAASDLLLAIALVATGWIPKTPAILTLIVTLCGLIPDQYGQAMWTWPGVQTAINAVNSHDFGAYLAFESHLFRLIAGWGSVGYLTGALGWTWCFASAGTWNRRLTTLSIFTWGLFGISTILLLLPPQFHRVGLALLTAAGNAIAFVLLMIWFIAVLLLVLRRSRRLE